MIFLSNYAEPKLSPSTFIKTMQNGFIVITASATGLDIRIALAGKDIMKS
jgi:hypothetical protein